jgi:DNA processing protein
MEAESETLDRDGIDAEGQPGEHHEAREAPGRRPGRVPGPFDSIATRGCHRLIHDRARLLETGVDDLITRPGLTASQFLATLSVLKLERLVRRLPGHQFVSA